MQTTYPLCLQAIRLPFTNRNPNSHQLPPGRGRGHRFGAGGVQWVQERIQSAADDGDLQEVYNAEHHLLYVDCTRARDNLLVASVDPVSEFLDDLRSQTVVLRELTPASQTPG